MERSTRRGLTLALGAVVAGAGLLTSPGAHAQGGGTYDFALSAVGPGAGRSGGSFGLGVFALNGLSAYPSASISYVRGIADPADFFLESDFGVLFGDRAGGVLGFLRPGFQVRFTPRGRFTLGLRAAPDVLFIAAGGGGGGVAGGLVGLSPGLMAGFGSKRFQVSLFADVPMYFAGALGSSVGAGAGGGFVATLRPSVVVEAALTDRLGFFVKGTPTFALSDGFTFAWVSVSAGLTF